MPKTLSQTDPEKGGETGESGVDPKNLIATHTGFTTFTAFFPVAMKKCQFLADPTSEKHIANPQPYRHFRTSPQKVSPLTLPQKSATPQRP